jgi:hypothetical protein
MPAELLATAKEANRRALETMHPLRRLEAANARMIEAIRRAEAAEIQAAQAEPLRQEIASLQDELASFRAGRAGQPDQDQKRLRCKEEQLLQRLAQATETLDNIMHDQQQSIAELRRCAEELVEAVKYYLLHLAAHPR